jgi:hypothetical protein
MLNILRRVSGSGANFTASWSSYQSSFGTPGVATDSWLGLNTWVAILNSYQTELFVNLTLANGVSYYQRYQQVSISNSTKKYVLNVTGWQTGTAGDALANSALQPFSTYDNNNDASGLSGGCTTAFGGYGWWYSSTCHQGLPTGTYSTPGNKSMTIANFGRYVSWSPSTGYYYSLTSIDIKLRRIITCNSSSCGYGYCGVADQCVCPAGSNGTHCENLFCNGVPVADPNVCGGLGTCMSGNLCVCNYGYSGSYCQYYTANCIAGYSGTTCQTQYSTACFSTAGANLAAETNHIALC